MPTQEQETTIEINIIAEKGATIPHYTTDHAAGADVRAYLKEPITLSPATTTLVPTGLRLGIPPGYEVQIRPRSGLALKHGVTVLNTPGTIDADYRGEVGVILINHSGEPFVIEPGMRIAQIIVAPVVHALFEQQTTLSTTARSDGGFGHTGNH